MEIFKFKHPRRVYLYTLLSFLMCMLGASSVFAGSRTPRNPIVKLISGPTYSDNGTEVTLKLWMYNYDGDNAYFTGNVMLRIDDKDACTLNNMWSLISNVYHKDEDRIKNYENRGNVGSKGTIILNSEVVGNAQFRKAQKDQKCPDNSNTGKWTTIELQLSFNNSFSYRKHTVSVKGMWRDRCDDKKYGDKTWDLQNTLHGFVYPTNLDFSFNDQKVKFKWDINGWQDSDNINGKWVLYKEENGTCVKQAEVSPTTPGGITIARKDFRCLATYYITFLPNGFSETATVSGLTSSQCKGSHNILEGVCRYCQHGMFSYTTTDGKTIPLASNIDFGSKILSHTVDNNGNCIIEFEGKFTRIPDRAFQNTKINSNNIAIPNTVTSIGSCAFNNTAISGSLAIPNSVTEIGESAFENCRELNSLFLPSNLKRIENRTFNACGFSGGLTIPNSVTEIGEKAFYNCTGFNGTLTLSNKLETIGSYAFYGCSGFTGSLTLPNSVTTIGDAAFRACGSFTNLELSNTLSVIPTQAFMNCRSLSGELVIPASVTEIGNNAFSDCQNLNAVTGQVTLPKSLEKIGFYVFGNTNNIKTVNFQSLPEGISGFLGQKKKAVSLSDESYISDLASGTVNEISYTRQMSNNWGTLVLPYSLRLTGSEPYHLYSIDNMTGEELVLKQLEGTVAAGTPCVVKRKGSEAELTFGSNIAKLNMERVAQDVGGMKFRGTYWTEDVNSGYVISKNSFWNVEELKIRLRLMASRLIRSALGSTALLPMLLPNSACASTALLLASTLLMPSTMPKQNTTTSAASVLSSHKRA